jgi:hypothetical protein
MIFSDQCPAHLTQFISPSSCKGIFFLHFKIQPVKHYFLFAIHSLITGTSFAQKLESHGYTIKIKIEKRSEDNRSTRTKGAYQIKKGSAKLSADFSALELNNNTAYKNRFDKSFF